MLAKLKRGFLSLPFGLGLVVAFVVALGHAHMVWEVPWAMHLFAAVGVVSFVRLCVQKLWR